MTAAAAEGLAPSATAAAGHEEESLPARTQGAAAVIMSVAWCLLHTHMNRARCQQGPSTTAVAYLAKPRNMAAN